MDILLFMAIAYAFGYFMPQTLKAKCDPLTYRYWWMLSPVSVPVLLVVIAFKASLHIVEAMTKGDA